MPKISVVIPCYNAHRYLADVLASVRAQSFLDYEIVIVDDGSTDPATSAFLESVGDDVRLVRKSNGGLSSARNAGFAAASGTYVLPLDADDEIAPDMLARTVAALEASPDAGYAYAQIEVFGDERGIVRKTWNLFEQLATNQLPYCLLMRRAVWEGAGGYDEAMREGYEDWEFNIRLSKLGVRGIQVESPLFRYRRQSTGMLQSVSQRRHAALWRRIRAKHADIYSVRALSGLWREWRGRPSTHPLSLVWVLLLATAALPDATFNRLFLTLHRFGASSRADTAMQAGIGHV